MDENFDSNNQNNPYSANQGFSNPEANPLYGVKGWLQFFVIVNLYVSPVVFVLRTIISWVGYLLIVDSYPGIVVSGIIETVVVGYLVFRAVKMAKGLKEIKPGAVQEARLLLKLVLGWTILSVPISLLSGIPFDSSTIIKGLVLGFVGFAVWYAYFNQSKRVQATYPDWNA